MASTLRRCFRLHSCCSALRHTCSCIVTAPSTNPLRGVKLMVTNPPVDPRWSDPVNVVALGWALTVTFAVPYLVCWLVALAAPSLPLAHGWLLIFSVAEPGSGKSLFEGIIASVVFAWAS